MSTVVTPVHGFALGRNQGRRFKPGWRTLTIDNYGTIPAAPATFDHTDGLSGFEMLGNGPDPTLTVNGGQPVGDCGVVGTVNVAYIDGQETGSGFSMPTSDTVVTQYLHYDHGMDQGVDLTAFLDFWKANGLPWAAPIVAHADVDFTDLTKVYEALNCFGCLYIGIAVPEPMDQQAMNGLLDLTGTRADKKILGGHCVVLLSRTADVGNGQPGGELATWGMRVKYTDRWLAQYLEEAHVVITEAQAARNGNGYSLDLDQLEADAPLLAA